MCIVWKCSSLVFFVAGYCEVCGVLVTKCKEDLDLLDYWVQWQCAGALAGWAAEWKCEQVWLCARELPPPAGRALCLPPTSLQVIDGGRNGVESKLQQHDWPKPRYDLLLLCTQLSSHNYAHTSRPDCKWILKSCHQIGERKSSFKKIASHCC